MRASCACLGTAPRSSSSWAASPRSQARAPVVRVQALAHAHRLPAAPNSQRTNAASSQGAAVPVQPWRPEHSPTVRLAAPKRHWRDETWHHVSAEENELHNSFYLPMTAWDATAVVIDGPAGSTGSDGTGWSSRTGL